MENKEYEKPEVIVYGNLKNVTGGENPSTIL
ncbi:hypothetical protein Dtox_1586 [Desulfofarcimen acetoxidans DSM 771]|uniref:Uncharacterized protein n=1 Tax=Desulfofarcimen acetoxidans (strain ATCC 49208 / DSM 771 / KCTC 5769 / VKM B-1644 / 5575) TaxID=485916 RepID=C8VW93_DESAS|nr:lasso RiPP family leader peptide-containing protein [Desulfofarcimen acetoxidans]ACV62445.1 hypothetical protein Dtox_1586 [Desulfofarcimen acetoxidans DSM 771]